LAHTSIAHITDIFSLAVTSKQIISASGSSALKVHSTIDPDFPLQQTLEKVHKLGCHHLAASKNGSKLASAGFDGEVKVWADREGEWVEEGKIVGADFIQCMTWTWEELDAYGDEQMAIRQGRFGP